jgi:hypothetical protein
VTLAVAARVGAWVFVFVGPTSLLAQILPVPPAQHRSASLLPVFRCWWRSVGAIVLLAKVSGSVTTTCEKAYSGNRSSARLGRGDLQAASAKSLEATKTAFFLARWKDCSQRGLSRMWLIQFVLVFLCGLFPGTTI